VNWWKRGNILNRVKKWPIFVKIHLRRKSSSIQEKVETSLYLSRVLDYLIDDSVFYCACTVAN